MSAWIIHFSCIQYLPIINAELKKHINGLSHLAGKTAFKLTYKTSVLQVMMEKRNLRNRGYWLVLIRSEPSFHSQQSFFCFQMENGEMPPCAIPYNLFTASKMQLHHKKHSSV